MKLKIILLGIIFITMSIGLAFTAEPEKTVQFAGQWPAYFLQTKAVAVDDDRALVFAGDGEQIIVLDSDLTPISTLKVTDTGQVAGIFYLATDTMLYAACLNDGLWIIDVSDPENPFKTGAYFFEDALDEINGVFVTGSKAYLSCWLSGRVKILDVTDTTNPSLISSLNLPGAYGLSKPMDILVAGGYAWVADEYNGINLIDVSDPAVPASKKIIALPGARDLALDGEYLYVTLESNGMDIVDVSDPEDPREVIHYDPADGNERAVSIDGDIAYLAYETGGIQAVDFTDKAAPVLDSSWSYTATGAYSIALFPEKKALYLTGTMAGLQKIDITDKSDMRMTTFYDTPADAVAIDVSGGYLYMVDDNAGGNPSTEGLRILSIFNINTAIRFALTGFCATPGTAKDVVVAGDYAYVADGDHGLQIISVLDKTDPEITGSYVTAGNAESLFISGGYAYVADGDAGLNIIDVSDKATPRLAASLETDGFAGDVTVLQNHAFVADGSDGLVIADIADPAGPKTDSTLDIDGGAKGVFAFGTYAYVAAGKKGMAVVGIADTDHPKLIGTHDTPGDGLKISVAGDFAYIADGKKGVCVINISNPARPTKEEGWSFDSTGIATDVFSGYSIDEELYALIADGPAGVAAVHLTYKDTGIGPGQSTGGGGGGCFIQALFR